MSFNEFMNKVRYWDNQVSKWIMRHFYYIFFQIVLFIVFLFWFVNMFSVIDVRYLSAEGTTLERILSTQSINLTIVVFLLLLNSFWLLYIFNILQRIITVLRDISFSIGKIRFRNKQQ